MCAREQPGLLVDPSSLFLPDDSEVPRIKPAAFFSCQDEVAVVVGVSQLLVNLMAVTAWQRSSRIASLDQFRGYTVLAMWFVNGTSGCAAIPAILKHHHTFCSYADTIMPQFLFAAGFAYRLTFVRRLQANGMAAACRTVILRSIALTTLGAALFGLDVVYSAGLHSQHLTLDLFVTDALERNLWQPLAHIAMTAMWILPVISLGSATRIFFAIASALLHLYVSYAWYYEFAWTTPVIDGGPLGFLTWTIPMIVGSLAYDVFESRKKGWLLMLARGAALLMAAGYGLSCVYLAPRSLDQLHVPEAARPIPTIELHWTEPPFTAPPTDAETKEGVPVSVLRMSLRVASASYLTFAAGFALAVFVLCVLLSERWGIQLGLFRTLGVNALAGYVVHGIVASLVKTEIPADATSTDLVAAIGFYLPTCYLVMRWLEKHKIFFKL